MNLPEYLKSIKIGRVGNPPLEGREAFLGREAFIPKRVAVEGSDIQPRPTGVSRAGMTTIAAVLARTKQING